MGWRLLEWGRMVRSWPGRAAAALRARWTRWADSRIRRDVVPYAVLLPALTVLSLLSPALLLIGASVAAVAANWILDRKDLLATSILMPLCLGIAALLT
jgi:hypothetical protein